MERKINIIALDVPYPPDYGGVIDIYYSIKNLRDLGFEIYLHCFTKGRTADLSSICTEYYVYKRSGYFSLSIPYIVGSRQSKLLEERLKQNNYPILFHGLHTTATLNKQIFLQRKNFLRMHNVEAIYYEHLARNEQNRFKKKYYEIEAKLLRNYEPYILKNVKVFPLSATDNEWVKTNIGEVSSTWIPCFIPWQQVKSRTGRGDYLLYQGNLSVAENEAAVVWLIEQVVSKEYPFLIAGKNPSKRLRQFCTKHSNVKLIANPTNLEMEEIIAGAQIQVLPSFNKTGIKLKLLHSLFFGRHVIANADAVAGSGTKALCTIKNSADDFREGIKALWQKDFTGEEILQRNEILLNLYSNKLNALKLEKEIFKEKVIN